MTWWDWRKGIEKVNFARESSMRHCCTGWCLSHEGCRWFVLGRLGSNGRSTISAMLDKWKIAVDDVVSCLVKDSMILCLVIWDYFGGGMKWVCARVLRWMCA